jgi:hypothetical protein
MAIKVRYFLFPGQLKQQMHVLRELRMIVAKKENTKRP